MICTRNEAICTRISKHFPLAISRIDRRLTLSNKGVGEGVNRRSILLISSNKDGNGISLEEIIATVLSEFIDNMSLYSHLLLGQWECLERLT